MSEFKSILRNFYTLSRYNMKIIFGGKFTYFILAALIFFLVSATIVALDSNELNISDMYGLIAFPAILLVFYPSVFGIQSDADQRTLEIIFGIPDYRYIEYSKCNIFLNPFEIPGDINDIVWQETIRQNRIIMGIVSVILILLGLLNLQQREKFLR